MLGGVSLSDRVAFRKKLRMQSETRTLMNRSGAIASFAVLVFCLQFRCPIIELDLCS